MQNDNAKSKILIANWKAHPETIDLAKDLFTLELEVAQKHPTVQVIICPPTHWLSELSALYADRMTLQFALGAQDVFWKFGEENYGVKYVLVGHSDRRYPTRATPEAATRREEGEGDTDKVVNQKIKIALESGVTPVLLVGERNKGDNRQAVIEQQLTLGLAGLSAEMLEKVMIAYEPVWAISTNPNAEPDTSENTLQAAKIIENITGKKTILYGGSVNETNITDFLSHSQISGAVIGRASLRPEQWGEMLAKVAKIH